jgi:hypothetical protein
LRPSPGGQKSATWLLIPWCGPQAAVHDTWGATALRPRGAPCWRPRRAITAAHGAPQEDADAGAVDLGQQRAARPGVGAHRRQPLAFQGAAGGENLLDKVWRGEDLGPLKSSDARGGYGGSSRSSEGPATVIAEGRARWRLVATPGALRGEGPPAGRTKADALAVLRLTVQAARGSPLCARLRTGRWPGSALTGALAAS